MREERIRFSVFPVRVGPENGWAAAVERGERISALRLPFRSRRDADGWVREVFPGAEEGDTRRLRVLRDNIRLYCSGDSRIRSCPLDLSRYSGFQRRVYSVVRRVPSGRQITYGEAARRAGSPGAARAVGQALRRNLHMLLVPCHRVVGSGGSLGGFTAPGGVSVKEALLQMESRKSRPA